MPDAVDRSGAAATPLWVAGQGDDGYTTARVGMMCVSRYENTGDIRYRELVHAAADAYRDSAPPADAETGACCSPAPVAVTAAGPRPDRKDGAFQVERGR